MCLCNVYIYKVMYILYWGSKLCTFHICILYILFKKNKFIYLSSAALGLRCCTRALSSCGERGLLFVAVRGLLMAVASLAVEHGL